MAELRWPSAAPARQVTYMLAGTALASALVTGLVLVRRRRRVPTHPDSEPVNLVVKSVSRVTSLEELQLLGGAALDPEAVEEVAVAGLALAPSLLMPLGTLRSLRVLDLGRNGLTHLPAGLFPGLPELQALNLAGNELTSLPEDIGALGALRCLGLKGNALTSLPPGLGSLTSLVELYLTDNALHSLPPEIGQLASLVKLQASFNRLTTLPPEMGRLRSLELLRVACCAITTLPAELAALPALCWVSLAGNPVAGAAQPSRTGGPRDIGITDLVLGPKLGEGASGDVFSAHWEGREVALKLFVGETSPDGHAEDEESVACAVADPCLVRVLARVAEPRGLVMGLIQGKPLAHKPDHRSLLRCTWAPGTRYTLAELLRIAHGVAAALAHMHGRGIAHGDVYAHNVLAGPSGDAVLCDYGASFWYDPASESHYELQEVRAFGLLLTGLLQHLDIGFHDMEVVLGMQKALHAVVQACLSSAPAKRPRFAALAARLRSFQLSSHHAGATSRAEAAATLRSSRIVLSDRSTSSP